jgi:excisionase family DNA binding protein
MQDMIDKILRDWMTVNEIAEYFNITRATVYAWARVYKWRRVDLLGHRLFNRQDVEQTGEKVDS